MHLVYGCETWSSTLMEEHTLKVSEDRVLRNMCGYKLQEVTGYWTVLHNEELHGVYCSPNTVRVFKSTRIAGKGVWHTG